LSWSVELGTLSSPGAGFFPFMAAVLLGVLSSIFVIIGAFRKARKTNSENVYERFWLKRPFVVFIVLILYALLLNKIGYLMSTFILFCFLFNVVPSRKRKWWLIIPGSLVTALASYLAFDKLLLVLLPRGIFGF